MNIYHLLKIMAVNRIPAPLKILGLWGIHVSRRRNDTYESYHRRMHTGRKLFRLIWGHKSAKKPDISKKLNYTIQ